VGTLRGAGVSVDTGRLVTVLIVIGLLGLAVLIVILFLAGASKNSQIDRLRQHGVPVDVRVSGCLGLLGGSGSNPAGYACRGSFTLDGHRHSVDVPGNVLRAPGSIVRAVTVRDDPQLIDTVRALATEHSSGRVFILPAVLLAVELLALLVLVLVRRRRGATLGAPAGPGAD
jgi:hypothetical protein